MTGDREAGDGTLGLGMVRSSEPGVPNDLQVFAVRWLSEVMPASDDVATLVIPIPQRPPRPFRFDIDASAAVAAFEEQIRAIADVFGDTAGQIAGFREAFADIAAVAALPPARARRAVRRMVAADRAARAARRRAWWGGKPHRGWR